MIISEKITSKSIRLYPVFNKKNNLNLIKKWIIPSKKMRKSVNYNYNYAHSFFGEDF